jgi:PAS domain S-box-containing protein
MEVLLHSVNDGITAQDAKGQPIFANQAAAHMLGFDDVETLVNAPITATRARYTMLDPEGNPIPFDALPRHKVFREGKPGELTMRMHNPETGDERWLLLKSSPVFDERGQVKLAVNILADITQRVALSQTRNRMAAIVENLNAALISKNLDGTIATWNPGAEALYGYTPSEVVGQPVSILFPEDSTEGDMLQRVLQGEDVRNFQTIRRRKDGSRFDISLTISPIRDSSGRITGFSAIEYDISEQRKLERLREESAEHLRKVLDALPILVGVLTPDGILMEANKAALSVADLAPEDVLGKPFTETYWWSYSPEVQAQLAEAIERARQGERVSYDVDVRVGEDQFITIAFGLSPMLDTEGNVTHIIPFALDISERKKTEKELRQLTLLVAAQRQRLDNIIDNIPGIVWEGSVNPTENDSSIDFINDYAEKMLGYSTEEWLSMPDIWRRIIHPDDWDKTMAAATAIYESGKPGSLQYRCIRKDGSIIPVESHTTLLWDDKGTLIGACGVIMDISERVRAQEALASYTQELKRSNEELEQFAYVASHDLQEPLRMVTSYLQLIEQRYSEKLDADAKEFIDYAVDGATRMKRLINDLLIYSRVQRARGEFDKVDMQRILEQAKRNLQLRIADSGAVITSDPLPTLVANEGQMLQLFQNLLGNAIKFRAEAPPRIHVSAVKKHGEWIFSVCDNGIGIESAYLDRIFVIFQRLHPVGKYPGTGIGLAICRKIVEQHGGQIWVESQPGQGTTFYFSLPAESRKRSVINGNYGTY